MTARTLIADIPPLTPHDTVALARDWMLDYHVRHLPVVDTGHLLGLVAEEDCWDESAQAQTLDQAGFSERRIAVHESQHLFEALRLFSEYHLTVLPVVSAEGRYIGLITLDSLLRGFAQMAAVTQPGGIIVLSLEPRNYSLSELARLIESENAHILSSFVSSPLGAEKMEVTLKISKQDLKHINATLERFGYSIAYSFYESDELDTLKERYDLLMNYMKM
jgi:acetoin utilization protein AcuB